MPEETTETLRPLLFSIAYRMLGSVGDAEDLVQEAFVRHQRAVTAGTRIDDLKAYLSATVTRLAIDQLRSARVRRESYVGQWLPEPLLTDGGVGAWADESAADPAEHAELADSLSMAFLLVLERLSPVERAVFLLRDVFDYEYGEIAAIVGKSEANCRQLATRARRHLAEGKPRFEAERAEREQLASRFFAAVAEGEVDELVELLAADVVVYGDGGGKAPQWSVPIAGASKVAKLLGNLGRTIRNFGLVIEPREVNGQAGALVRNANGQLINVLALDIADGRVQAVRSVINPDKLRHLGPLADLRALPGSSSR
ncbi:RNA polymerase sigma-70 factor [Pseudonocardia eucalypti]|uniref:RNA polymerase sigma-70 factor n=1 Tax=Pseudonocardia eucalypti TaxID=648755 RepID=A0ABP9R9R1_9PSEU|nr:RNA polymerase sigma-70 factor (ECF subfamily) [Pseudonocardia eucalypti]